VWKTWTGAFIAGVALVALLVPALPAAADGTVLTVADVGGPALDVGDVVSTAVLAPGLSFQAGNGGVVCAAAGLAAVVGTDPAAPGTATASVATLPAGECASTIPGCGTVRAGFQNLPYDLGIGSDGTVAVTGGPGAPVRLLVTCGPPLGSVTCVYQPAAGWSGTIANTARSIMFAAVKFSRLAGPLTCPARLLLSGTYAQLADDDQLVYLN
jgi:hypothetical protein